MPRVITQACCNDAGCTQVCPVDCIHPTPGEPGFGEAEMLYIDPQTCIDCGACMVECPVGAIYEERSIPEHLQHFVQLNRAYFGGDPVASDVPSRRVRAHPEVPGAIRVAIVGTGPAACFATMELLDVPGLTVLIDMYERLPTPWGLIRSGIAPDHLDTKQIASRFDARLRDPRVRMFLNIEIGKDISLGALQSGYHAVILAGGAPRPRALGIPGEELLGSEPAAEFMAWTNGHPDRADLRLPRRRERVVIIGNGNVALDAARVLLMRSEELHESDASPMALAALASSATYSIDVLGRRGPEHIAATVSELMALSQIPDLQLRVDPNEIPGLADSVDMPWSIRNKIEILRSWANSKGRPHSRELRLRFNTSPVAVSGHSEVTGLIVHHRGQDSTLAADLVLRAVGHDGQRLEGAPFDDDARRIPSTKGRVVDGTRSAGTYITGWARRGASGVMGTNKQDAHETVTALLEDLQSGTLQEPAADVEKWDAMLAAVAPNMLTRSQWERIDHRELKAGSLARRPRVKVPTWSGLLHAARGDAGRDETGSSDPRREERNED